MNALLKKVTIFLLYIRQLQAALSSCDCLNGGICMTYHNPSDDSVVQYCECPLGYGGGKCELEKTECHHGGLVCFNGGTCKAENPDAEFPSDITYRCACPAGFDGAHCEARVMRCSDSLTCLNGGVCKNSTTSTHLQHYCDCPSGFDGTLCQIKSEKCTENLSCYNGGICMIDESNRHYCQCGSRFGGLRCELQKVQCRGGLISCLNGGWCVDEDESDPNSLQKCKCKSGFEGSSCQSQMTSTEKEAGSPKDPATNQTIIVRERLPWFVIALGVFICFMSSFLIIIFYIRKQNSQAVVLTHQDKENHPQEAFVTEDVQNPPAAETTVV